ncbi:MAG: galactokinase [Phototrophicaceae bacterium]
MSLKQYVIEQFIERFHTPPTFVVRAPGRVNLIGEHTDYNDGFVLPMAIEHAVWIALRPTANRTLNLAFVDFDQQSSFHLDQFEGGQFAPIEYVKGMARKFLDGGYALVGWEGVMSGNVPAGAGLSSSAAVEMAIGQAFQAVSGFRVPPHQLAQHGQWVENEWLKLKSGIMDQMISACGVEGHALLIDCRSLETQLAPLPTNSVVVIMDTGTRRNLVDGKYNERFNQCAEAAHILGVNKLRDASLALLEDHASQLDPLIYRRARHVISENERTLQACEAMRHDDATQLGQLMNASHASLRDDFEVSGEALNKMVEIAQAQAECFGARMTGGGFAGCTVALVDRKHANAFAERVLHTYRETYFNDRPSMPNDATPQLYVCTPSQGAQILTD